MGIELGRSLQEISLRVYICLRADPVCARLARVLARITSDVTSFVAGSAIDLDIFYIGETYLK